MAQIVRARGDITQSGIPYVVVPVNCVGVAGKGLAKKLLPKGSLEFASYKDECTYGRMAPGNVVDIEAGGYGVFNGTFLLFPTKRHWKDLSLWVDIDDGLWCLTSYLIQHNVREVAIPALGCGLGGLPWEGVRPLIVAHLQRWSGLAYIYEPHEGQAHENIG